MADRSAFDQNNRNALIVVSNTGSRAPVELWADPTTHALITSSSGGGGGGDVNLIEVGGAAITLGPSTTGSSLPVTLATDQPNINVAVVGTITVNGTGTFETDLYSVSGNITSVNNGTADTGTQRVTIASDSTYQPTLNTGSNNIGSITDITGVISLPTGASTSALQTTGNTSLATIATAVAPFVVSNAGGYIRQDSTDTIAKETGGNLATLAGAVTSSVVQINNKQINGVVPLMGNGVTGTGSQRVTIASDNTAFSVNATLSAETTKVIGTVNQGTSPWVVSGTVTSNIGTTNGLALDATLTGGTQQTKISDGTNVVGVLSNAGVVSSTQNAELVAGAYLEKTGLSTASTTNNDLQPSIDVSNYKSGSLQLLGTWTGTVQVQVSNDNTTFSQLSTVVPNSTTLSGTITINSTVTFPLNARYLRVRVTAGGTGTVQGVLELYTTQLSILGMGVTANQGNTWTVGSNSATGSAVPANGFYLAGNASGTLAGVPMANSAGDVDGDTTALQVYSYLKVSSGSNWAKLRTANAASNTTGTGLLGVGLLEWDGTNYQRVPSARFAPSGTKLNTNSYYITTNTTTTPTSSTAYVSSIAISSEVAGTTSTVSIQDKQGTPLKLVNGFSTTTLTTTPTVVNFQTPVLMTSGIDIVTAGAVAATIDVFINWYQ